MKLMHAQYKNQKILAVLSNDRQHAHILKEYTDMIELIQDWGNDTPENRAQREATIRTTPTVDLSELQILAPIERPIHDIICVGVNYASHIDEVQARLGAQEHEKTIYFGKRATHIAGPGAPVPYVEDLDYECELALIIAKTCTNIKKEEVPACIFGYTIANDYSARTLQKAHRQWFRGKSLDGLSVMGPWIETEVPVSLHLECYVNKEKRQDSNTSLFLADPTRILTEFSQGITLEAGDIISTGTPGGTGLSFDPPRYLKKGDVVTCRIEGIGTLENTIE